MRLLKNYSRNTDGNVAMMFSASLLMLLIATGAVLDHSSATQQQGKLQDMVDAATLAAAKSKEKDPKELQKIAEKVIEQHNTNDWDIKLIVTVVDDILNIEAATSYDTMLMGITGRDDMNVRVNAGSPIAAVTPIKLALVLDTTESMEGPNITALRVAANELIDELDDLEASVATSVVPFGQYVNVGTSRRMATWLNIDKDGTTETNNVCVPERITITPRECTPTGNTISYDRYSDGRYIGKGSYEEQNCTDAVYSYTGNDICTDRTTSYTWSGCVGSRQAPYNTQADFNSQRITGVMNETCGTELMPLTMNLNDAKSVINSLTTDGDTYLPSGIMWGWRTLSDSEPLKESAAVRKMETAKRKGESLRAMLVMTDGANSRSQGGSEPHLHESRDKTAANLRTSELCTAAKADGITIFTVGYRTDELSDETKSTLSACASTPGHNFDASNAAELKATFKEIAGQLDTTRLAF